MKLVRLALLTLTPPVAADQGWQFKYGPVSLSTSRCSGPETASKFLLAAEIGLSDMPVTDEKGLLKVSGPQRELAEEAIEVFGNLLAVSLHARRHISSPIPWLGLVPETDDDRLLLNDSDGIVLEGHGVPRFPYTLDPEEAIAYLADRLDGVAIVSEAISSEHASGCFRELIRLFERAFTLGGAQLVKPLATFLGQAEFGYTEDEIKYWIEDVRHPLTHADRRADFLLEKDVRPYAGRVMQAAYEVLLNKLRWRDPETERRTIWLPDCGSSSADGDSFITKGCDAHLGYQTLDDALVFPIDLGGVLSELPEGVWFRLPAGGGISIARGPVFVKGEKPNVPT